MSELITGLAVALAWVTLFWLISIPLRNASIMDIGWGPGFLLIALTAAYRTDSLSEPRMLLALGMLALWSLRLAVHIAVRAHGAPEDPRYAEWRKNGGRHWWLLSLPRVFLLQGGLMFVLALPFIRLATEPGPDLRILDIMAVGLWLVGFYWESVADWQLTRHKSSGRGGVLDQGLWARSRHPNYFGEFLLWWGYGILFALSTETWWLLYSPLLMSFLLLKVSGVGLNERHQVETKPAYADYQARVPAFFPRFR